MNETVIYLGQRIIESSDGDILLKITVILLFMAVTLKLIND